MVKIPACGQTSVHPQRPILPPNLFSVYLASLPLLEARVLGPYSLLEPQRGEAGGLGSTKGRVLPVRGGSTFPAFSLEGSYWPYTLSIKVTDNAKGQHTIFFTTA